MFLMLDLIFVIGLFYIFDFEGGDFICVCVDYFYCLDMYGELLLLVSC